MVAKICGRDMGKRLDSRKHGNKGEIPPVVQSCLCRGEGCITAVYVRVQGNAKPEFLSRAKH